VPITGRAPAISLAGPIVALGDSYTAGNLLPLSAGSTPFGCFRSSVDYPHLVATALGDAAGLVNAACTSAGVADMTAPQHTSAGTNPPQLNSVSGNDSLIMLTLGGDDLGFSSVLTTCIRLSWTNPWGSPCERHYASGGTDQLAAKVTAEAPKMAAVLSAIRQKAPRARVLLVGYPDLFPLHGGCWPAVPITDGDIGYLRGIELQFNAMLASHAAAAGVTFVDTYDPTVGHDFCQRSSVRDVEGLLPATPTSPFHPNSRGQAAIAAQVLKALGALSGSTVLSGSTAATATLLALRDLPGQLFGQPQQRVGGAGHHILSHVGDSLPPGSRRPAQQVERLSRTQSVPLGQHSDGLLHSDPRR